MPKLQRTFDDTDGNETQAQVVTSHTEFHSLWAVACRSDSDGDGRWGVDAVVLDGVDDGEGQEGDGAGSDDPVDGALTIGVLLSTESLDEIALGSTEQGDGAHVQTSDEDDDQKDPEGDGEGT